MKKIILTTALVSTIVLAGATSASAAGTIYSEENTSVGIEFETDKPIDPGNGPFSGRLAIIWKPVSFEFGRQKAAGAAAEYANKALDSQTDAAYKKQWLVVNDDRDPAVNAPAGDAEDKTGEKWTVKVGMSKLETADKGSELPATLEIKTEAPAKYDIGTNKTATGEFIPQYPLDVAPTTAGDTSPISITAFANNDHKITNTDTLNLVGGEAAKTVFAKTDVVAGRVGAATEIKDVKLKVQAGVAGAAVANKSFSGQVTWTLATGYTP